MIKNYKTTEKTIRSDLDYGYISILDAIKELEQIGYSTSEAEALVDYWCESDGN